MDVIFDLPQWVLALGVLVASLIAIEIGFRLGTRTRQGLPKDDRAVIDTIYSGVLGVVALLLGFTFAMAVNRFDTRRQLVIDEANAIETAAVRSDLVDPQIGAELRACLREYADARLAVSSANEDAVAVAKANDIAETIQREMWACVRKLAAQNPQSYPNEYVTGAVNDVLDTYLERNAVRAGRVPRAVWMLLSGTVLVAMMGVGVRCGFAGKRLPLTTGLFALVISLILMIVVDLDRPGQGLIRVDQGALERVRELLKD